MEIIDAYVHCGIRKFQPIEAVENVMEAMGVSRAVIVQHLGEFDNSYIGDVVKANPERFAGACLVDHTAPDAADALERCAGSGLFKGVRFAADTLRSAPDLWHKAAELGLVVVLYAPDGATTVIDSLVAFLDNHPECRLVLSHMGNPNAREAPGFEAYRKVYSLADYPGVYYQVSGMKMFCPYPHEELHPLLSEAAAAFGTSRLIWGSNYPVVGDKKDYADDLGLLLEGRLPIPKEAIPLVAGSNARALWFADY